MPLLFGARSLRSLCSRADEPPGYVLGLTPSSERTLSIGFVESVGFLNENVVWERSIWLMAVLGGPFLPQRGSFLGCHRHPQS